MVYDFSFWAIFSLLTPPSPSPNRPQNQNLKKCKKKTPGDIIISILHMCNTCARLLKYGARRADRDRRTEKVTYKGGCPA